jgi:hypothetical protein
MALCLRVLNPQKMPLGATISCASSDISFRD